jgi:hypothetical protein
MTPMLAVALASAALAASPAPAPLAVPGSAPQAAQDAPAAESPARYYALRLAPGEDLKAALLAFARAHGLKAACVVSCAGSLRQAAIRFADQPDARVIAGPVEVVSFSGTLAEDGAHLHLAVADREGRTLGGHLMPGCLVYTTAEIVVAELERLRFRREPDPKSGYRELVVGPR